ncbi:glycosyltransferase [Paenibacillus sp. N3.4]|uniref:glycosyltransferase family 2 protein n=1 Tax=Paenibacillus sp. N3.4 TaxID=2603222 RepID=UPI0021C3875A|nr:glycosyltransferase [Paenibacillus sp. N3.4]
MIISSTIRVTLLPYSEKRIKCVKQQNLGVSTARNKGIEMAIGEFVTFVDGDDYINFDMLEKMYYFAESQKLDLTFCSFENNEYNDTTEIAQESSSNEYIRKMLQGKVQRSACGVLFNLDLIRKHSLAFDIDMSYGEDMLFTIKALLLTENKIGIIPYKYYVVEKRIGSAIRLMNQNQYERIQLLAQRLDQIFEYLNAKNEYELLLNRYYYFDILFSISHIVRSNIGFFKKLGKLRELKKSPHARECLNVKFESSKLVRIKALLIKYAPSIILMFFYKLNNTMKKV